MKQPHLQLMSVQQISPTDFLLAVNEKEEDGGSRDVVYLRIMLLSAICPLLSFQSPLCSWNDYSGRKPHHLPGTCGTEGI